MQSVNMKNVKQLFCTTVCLLKIDQQELKHVAVYVT